MKTQNKIFMVRWLVTMALLIAFNNIWQTLEIIFYGEIQERIVDTIISIPIAFSLYFNVKQWTKSMFL